MRLRLKHQRLRDFLAASPLSQNHWAIKLGLSRGHWSDIVNGRHPYPSPKTRLRMVEVLGVPMEDLFEAGDGPAPWADTDFRRAIADRYLIDSELGQGGMGAVYLARDVRHGRVVAVKVVSPEAVSGIGTDAFAREIATIAKLQHPHILPLFDSGEAAGQPFYVMPYVRGGSLRGRLESGGRLGLAEAIGLTRGIAAALHYAHGERVLHCDVKPENVLLDGPHPYVMDFGIARKLRAETVEWSGRGELDTSAGTPAYVSPEQASGEADLDARSDVYSLGCMVFEMLAGRPPFGGTSTREIVASRFFLPPPPVRDFAPDVPAAAQMVLERAMALPRAHRQPSAAALAGELESAAASASRVLTSAAVVVSRAVRRVRRGGLYPPPIGALMRGLPCDLIASWRRVTRRPRLAVLLTLTIALGIGSATAIFSLVDGVLWKPLPYRDADRLVWIARTSEAWRASPVLASSWDRLSHALPHYTAWAATQRSFEGVGAWGITRTVFLGTDGAELIWTGRATSSLAPLLGVRPAVGRWFLPGEDGAAAVRLAVLAHDTWRARFGADSAVVGRTVTLGDAVFEVIGVLPRGFRAIGQTQPVEVWTPAGSTTSDNTTNNYNFRVVGLLRAGVTLAAALDETVRLLAVPDNQGRSAGIRLERAQMETTQSVRQPLQLLLWSSLLLLAIACGNVATLLVGEIGARHGELATRISLGASRMRVARQLLTENLLLATLGATVGVGLAFVAVRALRALAPTNIPRMEFAHVDLRGVGFAILATLLTATLCSLAPVAVLARTPPASVLRAGSARFTARQGRLQRWGVAMQSALVVLLLVGAALLLRTHQRLLAVELGFRADELLSVTLRLPSTRYPGAAARRPVFEEAAGRVAALPGIASVTTAAGTPFQGWSTSDIRVAGSGIVPETEEVEAARLVASHRYFETMGIRVRSGRLFDATDDRPGNAVIVNETLARRFWPGIDPIGQRVRVDDTWRSVVGVVGDLRIASLDEAARPAVFLPVAQTEQWLDQLVIRATGNPLRLMNGVRQILRQVDPGIAIASADRLSDLVERTLVARRFRATLITFFAVAAALLAAIGVYGVANGIVVRRSRELAIRAALGATPRGVVRLVLATMAVAAAGGALAGAGLALATTRMLRPFLFGVSPHDAASFGVAIALVVGAALAASWPPARRATRIELMQVLRAE